MKPKVLILCIGNSCRRQMAEDLKRAFDADAAGAARRRDFGRLRGDLVRIEGKRTLHLGSNWGGGCAFSDGA